MFMFYSLTLISDRSLSLSAAMIDSLSSSHSRTVLLSHSLSHCPRSASVVHGLCRCSHSHPSPPHLRSSCSSFVHHRSDKIKVSTATYSALVSNSYPPSQGSFDGVKSFMEPIIQFLAANKSPLLANIYPYFAYNGDQQHITLPYALFTASDDQSGYQNLFDAMLDAMYSAVEKAGGPRVEIVVSESGWPSDSSSAGATLDNAGTYYKNLIQHVNGGSGTPKRPGKAIETCLLCLMRIRRMEQELSNILAFFPPTSSLSTKLLSIS